MLKLLNITKEFGGIRAINNVSFNVKQGEILSIIGPNGAGKTTLFNLLTGLIKSTKGTILFEGNEVIPEDHPEEFKKLKINSLFLALYSVFIMGYFYFIYKNQVNFLFEYTLFIILVLTLRLFAVFRLNQRRLWAKGFLTIMLFFDSVCAIYFAFSEKMIMPGILIIILSLYFYLYFIRKKTKHLFEEFLEAENIANMGIARTFQNIRLFQNLKVIENILIGFHNRSKANLLSVIFKTRLQQDEEKKLENNAMELLEFVGVKEQLNNLASNLPYGEQRKLEIARALALNPKLLLLDEPAAGMNPKETQDLLHLIKKIRQKGITVILIEHDMNLVMNISDRIVVLDHGALIAQGLPEEIKNNKKVIEAYLGGN